MDVLESEHMLIAGLAREIAIASLGAHEAQDPNVVNRTVVRVHMDALSSMPYITANMPDPETQIAQERKAAIEKFQKKFKPGDIGSISMRDSDQEDPASGRVDI